MSAKYFKRGTREFYQVTPERIIRIINKAYTSEVTIAHTENETPGRMIVSFLIEDALEGTEITREEFSKEFEVASRLIVLEP